MKKIILISFAVAIATVNGFAQEKKGQRKTPEQRTEMVIERLNEKLALTDAQKPKVKEAILKQEQQKDALRKQFEDNREAFKEANKKNMKATDDQLKTILTAEQLDKMKQLKEEQEEKRKNKRMQPSPSPANNGDQVPPPPPQPK